MKKILVFLRGFGDQEKHKLAMITAILISIGLVTASVLNSLFQEQLVKDGWENFSHSPFYNTFNR